MNSDRVFDLEVNEFGRSILILRCRCEANVIMLEFGTPFLWCSLDLDLEPEAKELPEPSVDTGGDILDTSTFMSLSCVMRNQ